MMKLKKKTNYVGIEFECISAVNINFLCDYVSKLKLDDIIEVADDGSIDTTDTHEFDIEFRFISSQKDLRKNLTRLNKLFKVGLFEVNDSCGLHVHLDMRNRDFKESVKKLYTTQRFWKQLVKNHRIDYNDYCLLIDENESMLARLAKLDVEPIEKVREEWGMQLYRDYSNCIIAWVDRYSSINPSSYEKHKTVEVRLHEGTLDVVKVYNWCQLLLSIVETDFDTSTFVKDNNDFFNKIKLKTSTKRYIDKQLAA